VPFAGVKPSYVHLLPGFGLNAGVAPCGSGPAISLRDGPDKGAVHSGYELQADPLVARIQNKLPDQAPDVNRGLVDEELEGGPVPLPGVEPSYVHLVTRVLGFGFREARVSGLGGLVDEELEGGPVPLPAMKPSYVHLLPGFGFRASGFERRDETSEELEGSLVPLPAVEPTYVHLRFRGGLVFKAHRLLYHSTLGLRVIKKKQKMYTWYGGNGSGFRFRCWLSRAACRRRTLLCTPGLAVMVFCVC